MMENCQIINIDLYSIFKLVLFFLATSSFPIIQHTWPYISALLLLCFRPRSSDVCLDPISGELEWTDPDPAIVSKQVSEINEVSILHQLQRSNHFTCNDVLRNFLFLQEGDLNKLSCRKWWCGGCCRRHSCCNSITAYLKAKNFSSTRSKKAAAKLMQKIKLSFITWHWNLQSSSVMITMKARPATDAKMINTVCSRWLGELGVFSRYGSRIVST